MLVVIVAPAWKWYIVPTVIILNEQQEEEEEEDEEEEEEEESTSISSTTSSESESVAGSATRNESKELHKNQKDRRVSDDRGSEGYNDGGDRRDSVNSDASMLEQGQAAKAKQLKEPLLVKP